MAKSKPTYQELENEISKLELELKIQNKLINKIPNPLFVKDKDFIYTNCNDAFSEYLGIPKSEIINSSVYDISPSELADKFYNADCELRDNLKNQIYESKVRYADGTQRDIIFNKARLVDDDNNFHGIVGIMLDITERKKTKQELEDSNKNLAQLNLTKDKLFSIIAHDLRAPFSSILGFSELLLEDLENTFNSESKEYLGLINSTTRNTLVLLDNLLQWAKSQIGKISYEPKEVNLSSIIKDIIENSFSLAKAKNITIEYNPSKIIAINGSKNMLETILRNLISNAIKFSHPGGKIIISEIIKQSHVEISIADQGVGLNPKAVKNLFDDKINVTTKGTNEEVGTGLGLLLCKEFVEKHDGKIWAESELHKGSNFKFTLPLNN